MNNVPDQLPGRSIISFFDWNIDKARQYELPFRIIEEKVKPDRVKQKDKGASEFWWRFLRPRNELYTLINPLSQCFVITRVGKYLNFSRFPTNFIFLNTTSVLTTDRWDIYTVVQSTLHEAWARKYSMSLKQDLQYSPSDCFDTFPFPADQWQTPNPQLAAIGERYHEYRRALMRQLWVGLTDLYNLFHARELNVELVAKVSKKTAPEAEAGYQSILELRRLHRALDNAIRDAYEWSDLDLEHNFYEIETLPENDRVRYTISPAARKEVLRRLLALNHQRAAEEAATQEPVKKKGKKKAVPPDESQEKLF